MEENLKLRPTRIRVEIMKPIYICPDCGAKFQEGFVPNECTQCGCPSSAFTCQDAETFSVDENVSPNLESSNNFAAEHVINGLAEVNKWVGVLVGGAGIVLGFILLADDGFGDGVIATILIIFGLLFFLISILFWALLKLLVNISYRLTRLDNKYNPQ